jgi:hypothetical protein
METLAKLLPVVWILAFLSPLIAIVPAVFLYGQHCAARPKHRIPALVYALILLVCAIVAFPLGLFFGIDLACTSDSESNLCGLAGFFVVGPLTSALAIILVGWLILLLPPDCQS